MTKTCSRCRREKPFAEFPPCKRTADGFQAWCRSCFREYKGTWYALKREAILAEKKRQYARQKHGESVLPERVRVQD